MKPKNIVRLTPRNKDKTMYDMRKGKEIIVVATTTIWKAVKLYKGDFEDDE